jgi:hypothetical protein
MKSKDNFAAFEFMCRERAALAKKEMEYWLAEADEWRKFVESPDSFTEGLVTLANGFSESGGQ